MTHHKRNIKKDNNPPNTGKNDTLTLQGLVRLVKFMPRDIGRSQRYRLNPFATSLTAMSTTWKLSIACRTQVDLPRYIRNWRPLLGRKKKDASEGVKDACLKIYVPFRSFLESRVLLIWLRAFL